VQYHHLHHLQLEHLPVGVCDPRMRGLWVLLVAVFLVLGIAPDFGVVEQCHSRAYLAPRGPLKPSPPLWDPSHHSVLLSATCGYLLPLWAPVRCLEPLSATSATPPTPAVYSRHHRAARIPIPPYLSPLLRHCLQTFRKHPPCLQGPS
jgi:hypothetical protein